MHYASHQYIPDAMVLIDNQVAVYDTIMHGYLIPHGLEPHQKRSLSLRHQKYQNQTIPAAVIQQLTLYMVLPNEPYYISNGIHFPIIQEERQNQIHHHGFDYISIEMLSASYPNLVAVKAAIVAIAEQYHLEIAYSYQEAIAANPHEQLWGCLNDLLNRTFYLKKKKNKKWKMKDGKLIHQIRLIEGIKQVGIPINRAATITPDFEITYQYDTEKAIIQAIEKKYQLTPIENKPSYQQTYYYQSKQLLPSNKLLQKLMQEKDICFAMPSISYYTACC